MSLNKTGRGLSKYKAVVIVSIILVASYFIITQYASIPKQSILPGFEGMQNGINGYQVQGSPDVTLGGALQTRSPACSYAYQNGASITSASVNVITPQGIFGCSTLTASDTVTIDAEENPVSASNPFTVGQTVNYYVPVPGHPNQYQYVTGQVEVYTFNLDFSIQSGSSGNWNFGGDTVWFNLYSQVWNQASKDPNNSSISGGVFEAPLYAVTGEPTWQQSTQNTNQIDAAVYGHAFTFYSTPSTVGQTLASLANSNPASTNYNSTLNSQFSPDTRLQRLVYYPVSFISFKANCGILGCGTPPSVKIPVTLYTLKIGEYILTNPDKTQLGQRNQGCQGLQCLADFLGANSAWLALVATFGTLIATIIILAVFASPVVLAVIYYLSSRKGKRGL